MDQKPQAVEYKFISVPRPNSDDRYHASANKIYFDLIWLNGEVGPGAGDVARRAGLASTDIDPTVLGMIEKDLAAVQSEYHALLEKDLPGFNHSRPGCGIVPLAMLLPRKAVNRRMTARVETDSRLRRFSACAAARVAGSLAHTLLRIIRLLC